LSRKKGAAVAIIAVVAVIGGLIAYSAMPRQEEPGPAPVLTTIDRDSEPENESTTIAEIEEQPQQDGTTIANNTVIANNTIVINKPVYRNNTIIYQPVTINLENYRTTINQYGEPDDDDGQVDTSHGITIRAERIKSEGWSAKFTDEGVGMFTAVYDINGDLVKTGYADERGFAVEDLENTLYFVFPADCTDCSGSGGDIMFRLWEDGSRDRPRLVPADSDVTASYRLVVPEKPQKQVPLTPPPDEAPPEETPPDETETAAEPEIAMEAHNATYAYGWVQVSVQLENPVEGFDEVLLSVFAPNGTLHDSFSYSDQQGFFASREAGDGDYRIAAMYEYGGGTAEAEITHPIRFPTPEFVNLSATEDGDGVRLDGMLRGGLAGENITIALYGPEGEQVREYAMSFGTKPVFTLFIASEDAGAVFNQTGNYTFAVTHDPTGVQGNTTLSHDAGNETETAAAPVNASGNPGRSERAALAAQGSDIFLVWQDDASGQQEILFAKSGDSGATFGEPVAIGQSEEGGFSITPDIAISGDNVYVVWSDYDSGEQSATAFIMSSDSGETFGNATVLGNYTGENADPQVALFGGDIYVSWVSGSNEEFTGSLMLARSSDGAEFEAAIVGEDAVNAVMASSGDALYLAWRHHTSGDTTEEGMNMFGTSADGVNFEVSENLEGMAIYAMAASGGDVYVAGFANETVVLARSSDGASFNATDIGSGSSPHVAASGSGVFIVWSGDEIMLASSSDGGETFEEPESISSDGGLASVAVDENTYVAWTENSDIMVAAR
jgi:hypothetical protein